MNEIPFLPLFHAAIRAGEKTMTCRRTRYGKPGDILTVKGTPIRIRLTNVEPVKLGLIAEHFYKQEGCETPQDFIDVWNRIHPRRRYWAGESVWWHTFHLEMP